MINVLKFPCVAKVLPLVYDESLSYYELLCKVVERLNEMIVVTNENTDDIVELKSAVAEIQEWIENFDTEGFAKLTGANFIGDVTNTHSFSADGGFFGDLTGDVTGNVTGNVTGDVTGDSYGVHHGNVTGNVNGNVTGNVTGNLTGNVTGDVHGDVTGDLYGDVHGDVTGNVTGNLTGNVSGNVTGNVSGNLTGNVNGSVSGTVTGDTYGTHHGDVVGDVTGNADSATALDTPRDIMVNLASDSSEAFDGSSNVDIGVKGVLPVAHGGTGNTNVDNAPTANSTKMVTSGGVKTALDAKQDALTFDTAPTQGSDNPVTSGGVYEAISQAGVGVVSSVFGRVGVIVAGDGDYNAGQVTYDGTQSGLNATRVQGAIDELNDKVDNLPLSLSSLTDTNIVTPTNGQVLRYDATANKWVNSNEVVGIAPDNCSGIAVVAGDGTLEIKWSDPDDTVVEGQTICTWAMTKLVLKTGGYPANENDGTVVVTNSVRNQYQTNGYVVNGLTNGTTYYFQLFPISDGGAVNRNVANRASGVPTPNVTITLTLNGAKEDTIAIYDSQSNLIGTCVFGNDATSGTFSTIVASGYSDTWTFTSSVTKNTTDKTSDYSKTATVTDSASQTVNVYPDGAMLWGGNPVKSITAYALALIHGSYPKVLPTINEIANETQFVTTCADSGDTNMGGALFDAKIDLTNISAFKWIKGTGTGADLAISITLTGANGSDVVHARFSTDTELDVSSYTGEYYVGFETEAPRPVGTTTTNGIKQLWYE